jgi:membrane protease YdiL (CAAX protease family)
MLFKKISPSVIAYLILLIVIIILRLLINLFPSGQTASQIINLTDTLSIGVIWLIGWVGVYLAPGTGFTGMWQKGVSQRKRFLEPALVGMSIGLLSVVLDLIQPLASEELVGIPASLVAYPLAGIIEEIVFRLFLTTTLVWIFSNMLLRGNWQELIFWAVNVFLGVFYTLSQLAQYENLFASVDLWMVAHFFIMIALYFILAAFYYRRYGFLAAISMSMGNYLVWHILWGGIFRG